MTAKELTALITSGDLSSPEPRIVQRVTRHFNNNNTAGVGINHYKPGAGVWVSAGYAAVGNRIGYNADVVGTPPARLGVKLRPHVWRSFVATLFILVVELLLNGVIVIIPAGRSRKALPERDRSCFGGIKDAAIDIL